MEMQTVFMEALETSLWSRTDGESLWRLSVTMAKEIFCYVLFVV